MPSETFLASFGLIGLRLVELHGVDARRFAEQMGIASIDVPAPCSRLPSSLLDSAFERAAGLITDPAFALRAAECWHPSHLGTLGYAWLSSGSLRTALKRMARFTRILGQRKSSRCADEADGLRFIYDHGRGDTPVGHIMADFDLSLIASMCRTNYGPDLPLEAVTLRRPAPADRQPHERFFACPVRFGASEDSLLFARPVVDKLLPTSNHELATTFDAILSKQLGELDGADLASRCKAWLLQELTSGEPSESDLARAMGLSSRTLQRKLAEQGMSYRSVLESTRYELALRYLDDPDKTVTDITFLLGFSEQSAFTRAFKRWNGKAPSAYRAGQPAHS
jgi:AraC-like DNA-binding protein